VISAPADGPVSWTAHADLAEAAAVVLTDEGRFEGPTPPLTGAEALDLAALAGIISSVLGRTVRRETLSDEDVRARIAARGLPPVVASITLGLYAASRGGEFAVVDRTLEKLIGRRPTPMRDVIAEQMTI
jgi:NAD(P)H dehydrogenase (quinone)